MTKLRNRAQRRASKASNSNISPTSSAHTPPSAHAQSHARAETTGDQATHLHEAVQAESTTHVSSSTGAESDIGKSTGSAGMLLSVPRASASGWTRTFATGRISDTARHLGETRVSSLMLTWLAATLVALRSFFGSALTLERLQQTRDAVVAWGRGHDDLATVAQTLRIGVGVLFVAGGWNKLSQLLSTTSSDAIVNSYTSTSGYINEFFMVWMFGPASPLSPWGFLTALSAFELISGVMLIVGLLVRPLALVYAFLLWSFVVSLPVVTTNGIDPGVKTYMAPAIFVQIRDIALSGFMFALYGLGSGRRSLDAHIFGADAIKPLISWDVAGVLLRLSLAVVFIVGGLFAGMPNIKSFLEPGLILTAIGMAMLWGGQVTRIAGAFACAVLVYYIATKVGPSVGLVGSFNAIKREIALLAVGLIVAIRGTGVLWTATDIWRRLHDGTVAALENRNPTPDDKITA